jgi:hypothetical protein
MKKFLAVLILATSIVSAQADAKEVYKEASDQAKPDSAQGFVEDLYSHYKTNSMAEPLTPYDVQAYLTPSLAKLLKDKNSAFPCFDGDPFVFAQDWEISDFDISAKESGATHARAKISFVNQDEAVTLNMKLVKLRSGWKIDDVERASTSEDLRDMLNHCDIGN